MTLIEELLPDVRIETTRHARERFLKDFHGPPPNDIDDSILKLVRKSSFFKKGRTGTDVNVAGAWKVVLAVDTDPLGPVVIVVSCFRILEPLKKSKKPKYRETRAIAKRSMFIED